MIFGRHEECALLEALLDGARAGRSGVVVMRGEPGVGKSALLEHVADLAEDFQVIRARGVESEAELPFAGLHQLLRPIVGYVDALPTPQARAIRAALGAEQGAGDSPFLVSVGVLSVLAEAAETRPVLCVMDDAHWLDGATSRVLLFVARRLEADMVVMLFGARSGDVRGFEASGLTEIHLGALDGAAAAGLLEATAGVTVAAEVCAALVERTGGNALALVELASVLTTEHLAGSEPLPDALPLSEGVGRLYLDRVRRLPRAARVLLRVVSADDTGRLGTVMAAGARLGLGPEALDAAEGSSLLDVSGSEIDFRHPLVRSAVYQAATTRERQEAHRALAEVLTGDEDAERRAWHRAAASVTDDNEVAAELEVAAGRAIGRGGLEAACAAFERAADLTSNDQGSRARRLLAAARCAWSIGQLRRARTLLEKARPLVAEPTLRAQVDRMRAWIEMTVGSPVTAWELLIDAARDVAPVDGPSAVELLAEAVETAAVVGSTLDTSVAVRLAAGLARGGNARGSVYAGLLEGFGQYCAGNRPVAFRALRNAIRAAEDSNDAALINAVGHAAFFVGDDAADHRGSSQVLARARASGAIGDVLFSLQRLIPAEIQAGRWAAAAATATEARGLAGAIGQEALAAVPLAWLALLAALRGDEIDLLACARDAERIVTTMPLGVYEVVVNDVSAWARGIHALIDGQHASAVTHLRAISRPVLAIPAALDRVEAAVLAGATDIAGGWLRDLEDFAVGSGAAWAAARVDHCRALLSDASAAAPLFEAALIHHSRAERPFERARTELAYGHHLRRARRRVDSRAHLRAAYDTFATLGAAPWAEQARRELRASGETVRKREPSTVAQLTPQEVQVARFVARGLSNREVAAQLFLSPRTIDYHLRNVFTKLGVTSRTELAHVSFE